MSAARGRPRSWHDAACGAGRVVVLTWALGLGACRSATEPAPIGSAAVSVALAWPEGDLPVRITRTAAGTWFVNACEVRIQRRFAGSWQQSAAQPAACTAPWIPFSPTMVAEFIIRLPVNLSDGPHRLELQVLPYDPRGVVGPIPGLEEAALRSNSFEVVAIR